MFFYRYIHSLHFYIPYILCTICHPLFCMLFFIAYLFSLLSSIFKLFLISSLFFSHALTFVLARGSFCMQSSTSALCRTVSCAATPG